jgi:hypothetical protein
LADRGSDWKIHRAWSRGIGRLVRSGIDGLLYVPMTGSRFRVNLSEWTGPLEEKGSEPKPLLAGFWGARLVAAVGTAGIVVRDGDICLCHRV